MNMIISILPATASGLERSAFSKFIENCASWIGFDVWDWFAFLVASVSLYVAYVTFKSQRRTEKNTQALLTLDAQLMLFSDLFLKLYAIQMRVLCEVIRIRRAKDACCELYEYKVNLKMGNCCEERTFADHGMANLYVSDVPDSLAKHFEKLSDGCRSYRELVSFPNDFMIPIQNIHPELFYNNEFQFLMINRLVTHIDDFNHKYEFLLQKKDTPDLRMIMEDVSRIARETRDTVKEIYLFNDKVQKLYSGILANQIDEIDGFMSSADDVVVNDEYDDYLQVFKDSFKIADSRILNNIARIISYETSPLRDSYFDYSSDSDLTVTTHGKAERILKMGKELFAEKDYPFSLRCAQALVDYLLKMAVTTDIDDADFNRLKAEVSELLNCLNGCEDEVVWEETITLIDHISLLKGK